MKILNNHASRTNELLWRAATLEDLDNMHLMLLAAKEAGVSETVPSIEQMSHVFTMFGERLKLLTQLALTAEGQVVAMGLLSALVLCRRPAPPQPVGHAAVGCRWSQDRPAAAPRPVAQLRCPTRRHQRDRDRLQL